MKEKHHWIFSMCYYACMRLFFSLCVQMPEQLIVTCISGEHILSGKVNADHKGI